MLKYLAFIIMVLDHIALYFFPVLPLQVYLALRLVGRLAMPIFVYYLVLGLGRSRNVFAYLRRLLIWACLTEGLFLALRSWGVAGEEAPNVLFTLAASLLFLIGLEFLRHAWPDLLGGMRRVAAFGPEPEASRDYQLRLSLYGLTMQRRYAVLFAVTALLLSLALIGWLQPDYGYQLLALALCFYFIDELRDPERTWNLRDWLWLRPYALMLLSALLLFGLNALRLPPLERTEGLMQCFGALAVLFFPLANLASQRRRPSALSRLACYAFFPLHKLLIILASLFLA